MDIPAAIFKAECLKLMDQVKKTREPIVITKHGKPVAQLAPVSIGPRSFFGYMKSTLKTAGSIAAAPDLKWSAVSGDEDALYDAVRAKPTRRARRN